MGPTHSKFDELALPFSTISGFGPLLEYTPLTRVRGESWPAEIVRVLTGAVSFVDDGADRVVCVVRAQGPAAQAQRLYVEAAHQPVPGRRAFCVGEAIARP